MLIDTNSCHILYFSGLKLVFTQLQVQPVSMQLYQVEKISSSKDYLKIISNILMPTFSVQTSVSHFRVFLVHQINPSTHTTRSSSWYFQPHPQDAQFEQQPEKIERVENIIPHYAVTVNASGPKSKIYQDKLTPTGKLKTELDKETAKEKSAKKTEGI